MRLTLLHTNDIHGRVDGLAHVATLVERIRAETPHRVLYVDAGGVEETRTFIGNVTKGAAMNRLLSAAGCAAHTVGNAAWLRYGATVIESHAATARWFADVLLERTGADVAIVTPGQAFTGQVAGVADPTPAREYTVAGTDWELEPYGGMVEEEWRLQVRYDFPTIVREAIEEHLALQRA